MSDPQEASIAYRFDEFELLPSERLLQRRGSRIALTPRMFDLLLALVEADGHLLTKDTLLGTVWADAAVEEGNLNRTISAHSKAIGEQKGELRFIETVPKSGYRFAAPVQRSNRFLADLSVAEATTNSSDQRTRQSLSRRRKISYAA